MYVLWFPSTQEEREIQQEKHMKMAKNKYIQKQPQTKTIIQEKTKEIGKKVHMRTSLNTIFHRRRKYNVHPGNQNSETYAIVKT